MRSADCRMRGFSIFVGLTSLFACSAQDVSSRTVEAPQVERKTLLAWLGNESEDVADALVAQEFDTRETLQALTLDLLNQVLENERVPPRKLGSLTKILRRLHDHSGTQPETSKGAQSAHGRSVLRSLRNALSANCSFEDVESLVGNLILFDTFLFGFAVTLMTSTFSHDDLLAADTRHWILEPGCYASHMFMWCAMVSGQILVGSLLIGLFLAISLGFSDCREHKCSFRRWLVLGRPLTCVAYLMFIVGFGFFFIASSLAVDLIFPRYPISPTVGVQFCFPENEGPLRFNTSSNTLITVQNQADTFDGKYLREWWYPLSYAARCSRARDGGCSYGLASVLSLRTFFNSAALLILVSTAGIMGIVAFNVMDARFSSADPQIIVQGQVHGPPPVIGTASPCYEEGGGAQLVEHILQPGR